MTKTEYMHRQAEYSRTCGGALRRLIFVLSAVLTVDALVIVTWSVKFPWQGPRIGAFAILSVGTILLVHARLVYMLKRRFKRQAHLECSRCGNLAFGQEEQRLVHSGSCQKCGAVLFAGHETS
jgi:ribosomal protein S27AE